MRDVHRMKEKFELSLDNRQIVTLLISGIVVLGAVFILGVVVGKKLSTHEGAQAAPDLLTALDAKAAALEEARKAGGVDASFTFQDELTRKAAEPPRVEPPAVAVPVQPAEAPSAPVAEKAAPVEEEVAAPEEPETPASKPEPTVAARTASKDGNHLLDAIARAQKPAEAVPNGPFTLQLVASQDRAEADRFAARLRDKGFAPYIVEATVPGRGIWYRVRMGSFPSKEAATRYLQDFRRETQLDAFVASTN